MARKRTPAQIAVDKYFNTRVMYGGLALPRHIVIEDLRSKGIPEKSVGFWVSEGHEVEVTEMAALWYDQQWIDLQRIEKIQDDEGVTFAEAQEIMVERRRQSPLWVGAYCEVQAA